MFAKYGRRVVTIILLGSALCFLFACDSGVQLDSGPAVADIPPTMASQNDSEELGGNTAVPPTPMAATSEPEAIEADDVAVTPAIEAIEAVVDAVDETQTTTVDEVVVAATSTAATEDLLPIAEPGQSRGYQTTPGELKEIKRKADAGIEPYRTAVNWVLAEASEEWDFTLQKRETCPDAQNPAWNDNEAGTPILYAKALAYHLTGQAQYAEEVKNILQRIMTEVETITLNYDQCPLNFAWGTPELVAAADLIEEYWFDQQCTGPVSTLYSDTTIGSDACKALFQNWLVKNPYYIVSKTAQADTSNIGAAATTTTAYIADYLWDRPDVLLVHRNPLQVNNGENLLLTGVEAYTLANDQAIDRMNGYRVGYPSIFSCDRFFLNWKQSSEGEPVKSQITETGIIPEDARRKEFCNISQYDNSYKHSYAQLHLGSNIQQCELMLRRGDSSCYDNIDNTDIPEYTFVDPYGFTRTTHLYPGRGSIERAINAIVVDAGIKWQQDPALEVAYRYYYSNHTMPGVEFWFEQLNRRHARCLNHLCFGLLTHGFSTAESPQDPPVVAPPR